jgi:methyl-accepting chemotaxis protein
VVSSEPTGYLDKETTNKILELINKVSANFSDVETTKGDFEGLQEEMESWRDGMQGTNLESTDKYSRVEEAASNLSDVVSSLDQISEPTAPEAKDGFMEIAAVVEYTDELDQAADDIESAANDSENVEFPGFIG